MNPFKALVLMVKVLVVAWRNPPDQEFVNELYLRENAKYFKRHAGIGNGPRDVPDGKYLKRDTRMM